MKRYGSRKRKINLTLNRPPEGSRRRPHMAIVPQTIEGRPGRWGGRIGRDEERPGQARRHNDRAHDPVPFTRSRKTAAGRWRRAPTGWRGIDPRRQTAPGKSNNVTTRSYCRQHEPAWHAPQSP